MKAFRLPWAGSTVPRAILDVIRGCNITCDSCYNCAPESIKSLEEIESDLDFLISRRRLDAVSVIGGEVLLHPKICDIIRAIKKRGIIAEICTNGVLINDEILKKLKTAGIDVIFMHIELSQNRPDLPVNATLNDLRSLCETKAKLIAGYGIDAGLTITAGQDKFNELRELIKLTIESPHINFILVTCHRDHSNIRVIYGDLDKGMVAKRKDSLSIDSCSRLSMKDVVPFLYNELGLKPFSYMGSNIDDKDPRWISYLVGSIIDVKGEVTSSCIKSSFFELLFMKLSLMIKGKYPVNIKQNSSAFRLQLFFNALMGGNFFNNFKFLLKSFKDNPTIRIKKLLIQNLAEVLPDGRVIHCKECPDAVAKKDHLVPVCICDLVDVTG
ncbi:MAG: radical SAM protein [uncultured bacterium]|nr:MAG: radical SAM protein [uncultured bacterium]